MAAAPYVDRIDQDPARFGIEAPVSRPAPSVTLTPHERDVAMLVSQGLTNKEVAGRLFVSTKTVEFHLANVFSKLGTRSRRDLRDHPVLSQAAAHN